MATNDTTDSNQDETTWNGEQKKETHHEVNEGFSAENLPDDYDPSKLKSESEIDQTGNEVEVERARFEGATNEDIDHSHSTEGSPDNKVIENKESLQNRDRNYDTEPNRYPQSHPDNQKHRGNVDPEKESE